MKIALCIFKYVIFINIHTFTVYIVLELKCVYSPHPLIISDTKA